MYFSKPYLPPNMLLTFAKNKAACALEHLGDIEVVENLLFESAFEYLKCDLEDIIAFLGQIQNVS